MPVIKKYSFRYDLILVLLLSLLLAGLIALSGKGWLQTVRVIVGLPFVLFFPGYTLIAALFPKKADLDGIERVALSFGLSIAVVPLIGLGLNYTPWGIRLTPVLVSLISFIVIMCAITHWRRVRLKPEDIFIPSFEFELPAPGETSRLDKVLTVLLVISILFAIGSIVYVVTTPKVGEKFTEFYILGMKGKAEGYPTTLPVSTEGKVIVGVVNHEYRTVDYHVEVRMGDLIQSHIGPIRLGNEKKWEQPVSFSYPYPQDKLKVEFLLYRAGDTSPYRSLHLWVDIKQPAPPVVPKPVAKPTSTVVKPHQVRSPRQTAPTKTTMKHKPTKGTI